jgi:hypothetical protein
MITLNHSHRVISDSLLFNQSLNVDMWKITFYKMWGLNVEFIPSVNFLFEDV